MPAWASYIIKLILGLLIDKISGPIVRWIKKLVATKKYDKKVDKAVKGVEDAETKSDYDDAINRLP